MIFYKLLLLSVASLVAVNGQQKVGDENKLFFDFSSHSSAGWSGIEGWKWTPNTKRSMVLKGPAESVENHDVLVLDNPATNTATLTSPLLSARPGFSCLYFNYYVRVANHKDYGLTVSAVSGTGYKRRLDGMARQDYDLWETAAITVDRSSEIRIEFHGEKNPEGVIAVNGFFLRDGECQDASPIDCDFEGHGLCNWITNDPIHQTQSGNQKVFTVKPEDHTTDSLFGHTAIMTSDHNQAVMLSPIIKPSYHKCLSFVFMQNYEGAGLSVLAKGPKGGFQNLWTPGRNLPTNEWHSVQIPVELAKIDQFMINFTNYNHHIINAIQIDDIQLRPYCYSDVSGTFQYSMGEWRSPKSDAHRWQLGTGRRAGGEPVDYGRRSPLGVYTDFSEIKTRTAAVLRSYWVDGINFFKCATIEFQIRNFKPTDKFVLNMVDEKGGRKQLWSFADGGYQAGVIYYSDNIPVAGMFVHYRLELVAETDDPKFAVSVLKFLLENKATQQCEPRKRVTQAPGNPVTTAAPAVQRSTKLNPSVKALVSSLLKSLRTEVNNILHVIGDKADIVYELVDDVDEKVGKAISALI